MIPARDYSQCEDPAAAMRADAAARRAKYMPAKEPIRIPTKRPPIFTPVVVKRTDDEEAVRQAAALREAKRQAEIEQNARDDAARAEWDAMLKRAVEQYHASAQIPVNRRRRSLQIMHEVAAYSGFSDIDLKSPRRNGPVVWARQVACWLCKRFTIDSLPRIGRDFGNRDHTTILHACRKVDAIAAGMTPSEDTVSGWLAVLIPLERRA